MGKMTDIDCPACKRHKLRDSAWISENDGSVYKSKYHYDCANCGPVSKNIIDPILKRIAELEVENAELKEAAVRAVTLLNYATYHDGRYNQHTGFEWQKEACEVADILERLAPQPPKPEGE